MPPTLADYVETALRNLGGEAHLSKIYPEVRRLLTEDAGHIRTHLKAGIREVLERHSAESEASNKRRIRFVMVSKGSGIYRLAK